MTSPETSRTRFGSRTPLATPLATAFGCAVAAPPLRFLAILFMFLPSVACEQNGSRNSIISARRPCGNTGAPKSILTTRTTASSAANIPSESGGERPSAIFCGAPSRTDAACT